MTGLSWILQATNLCPDFPWVALATLCGEHAAIGAAQAQANGNPYTMFSNLAAEKAGINSAFYPNMVYAAQQILEQVCGEMSVKDYAGICTCRRKLDVDAWIAGYIAARPAASFPGAVAPGPAPYGAPLA